MNPKEKIDKSLNEVVENLSYDVPNLKTQAADPTKADYATNVAMRVAKGAGKRPLDIAYEIKTELDKLASDTSSTFDTFTVDIAPPGFVNFLLTDAFLSDTPGKINKEEKFGDTKTLSGQKVMFEYTDPNPFKEFHIGHLYSNIVGESLARLTEAQGAEVFRASYQGDVGLHIAKAIYGMRNLSSEMPQDDAELANRAQYMGKAYALGSTKYEESPQIKAEIDNLNKTIYEAKDEEINELYTKGRSWSLEYYDSLYARLGTKFNKFYFESEMAAPGLALVKENLEKGIFEESEGAVIFPAVKHGMGNNRVFINSLGIPTYEGKDMALAPAKYRDFEYDKSYIITAAEQSNHFATVFKALSLIEPEIAAKTKHIPHGLVKLPGGKMSSRTGDIITGEWLMDEAKSRVISAFPEIDDDTAEKVGIAAIKFAFLKVGIGSDITFNFDESIALTGASGPYLQYAYVRTKSILEEGKRSESITGTTGESGEHKLEMEEKDLIRHLIHFPEIITDAQEKLAPNLVAEYLFQTAQKFNLFYQKHRILNAEGSAREFRLGLTEATGHVIKNGLNLLGIETVDKM